MVIKGIIKKQGRWWGVQVPLLVVHTQGRTKTDALVMTKDAIEELVDKKGFKVLSIKEADSSHLLILTNNINQILAFALKQQRAISKKSIRTVAKTLGSKSPTAYSRYESGNTTLTVDKFTQLMHAIDPKIQPIISLSA